jgi:uncharacterized membrane protein YeaQ/YmgE (transglycosylase-associated protein family)
LNDADDCVVSYAKILSIILMIFGILWIIMIGAIAGTIAVLFVSSSNKISKFVLGPLLGIVGALLASFGGRAVGLYPADKWGGPPDLALGALAAIFLWRFTVALANELSAGRSTTSSRSSTGTLDISSFKRRQKYLMFVPRLLQIVYAAIAVYCLQFAVRLFLLELGILIFKPLSPSEGIFVVMFLFSLVAPLAIVPIVYYAAFLNSSHLLFVVATLMAAGYAFYVTLIEVANPDLDLPSVFHAGIVLPSVAIIVAVITPAYLLYIILARCLLNDPVAAVLRRGPPSAVIPQLYRYGAKSPIRALSNARRLILRTSIPFFVAG